MDYDLMTRKLEAVRKEIRSNVPSLFLVDCLNEIMDRIHEEVIWFGQVSPPISTA